MNVRAQVGLNVRRLRNAVGISQEELAHRAGLDRTYISGVERGIRNPTVLVLQDLASVLGVQPADLLAEVDGTEAKPRR
jgi:transcriptional regulator with XRE-family HTH domain